MSKVDTMRLLVNQRLTAAAEEIFELFERTIAEYEEQLRGTKEENQRQQKLLDSVLSPVVRLHRADVQQLLEIKEELPPEQLEKSSGVDQEDFEPPHIKEEQEELWSSQEGEQLQGLEEDISTLVPPVPVKREEDDGEEPQSSRLHEDQTEENGLKTSQSSETDDSSLEYEVMKSQSGLNPDDSRDMTNTRTISVGSFEQAQRFDQEERFLELEAIKYKREPFSCSICKKSFLWKTGLKVHMTTHFGEKPFKCSVCDASFSRIYFLNAHHKVHPELSTFTCSVCDTNFTRSHYLKNHMRIHTGERPFSCVVCGKSFTTNAILKRHLLIHEDEKPFQCSVCGNQYTQLAGLQRHAATHTQKKPYSCLVCGKIFTHERTLKSHVVIHKFEGEDFQSMPV